MFADNCTFTLTIAQIQFYLFSTSSRPPLWCTSSPRSLALSSVGIVAPHAFETKVIHRPTHRPRPTTVSVLGLAEHALLCFSDAHVFRSSGPDDCPTGCIGHGRPHLRFNRTDWGLLMSTGRGPPRGRPQPPQERRRAPSSAARCPPPRAPSRQACRTSFTASHQRPPPPPPLTGASTRSEPSSFPPLTGRRRRPTAPTGLPTAPAPSLRYPSTNASLVRVSWFVGAPPPSRPRRRRR